MNDNRIQPASREAQNAALRLLARTLGEGARRPILIPVGPRPQGYDDRRRALQERQEIE